MVAIKAQGVEAFLKSIDPAIAAVVVYGTDAGRVSVQAGRAAKAFAARIGDGTEILRLEDADLDADPDRLIVELKTIPMFGGGKVIRALQGRRINGPLIKSILEDAAPMSAALVVEAGNLKPSDAMRKAAEACAWAAALPCYADTDRDLGRLAQEMVTASGHTLSRDALPLLISRIGADHALSRGEIEKLITYVGASREITTDDIDAVMGDTSELSLDQIAIATSSGQAMDAIRACEKAIAGGQTAQSVLIALQRHFLALHKVRSAIEGGRSLDDALRQLRPPLHFSVRDAVKRAANAWSLERLTTGLRRIQETIRASRSSTPIEQTMAERLLFELSQLARAGQRR